MFKHLFVFPSLSNVCPQLFHFFPCKASFPVSMSLCLFLAFSQKSQSVNVRVSWEFSSEKVLCFACYLKRIFFLKAETILLQKVFASPSLTHVLGWYDLNRHI